MIRFYCSISLRIILIVSSSTNLARADDIAGLRQLYDGTMLPGVEVNTFSNSEKLQPVRVVHRGKSAQPLPKSVNPFPAIHFDVRGHHYDLYDYLADARVAGMLVLKNGEIAFEDYELGIGPDTHWISFSMAKSITSTLVGAAVSSANVGFSFRLRCAMMLCNRDAKINPLEGC